MANTKSALKRVRQTARRTAANRQLRTRVRTFRRKVDAAIASGDRDTVDSALAELFSAADKAARRRVIHPNAASRIKSRYTRKLAVAAS
ncbi:MAG TPA: 30S ribosomal protein S20 [Verrucomicrobiales bacterium]|nr:30S ribosomal protein S20 [Verrucomicrobiales bacterium]